MLFGFSLTVLLGVLVVAPALGEDVAAERRTLLRAAEALPHETWRVLSGHGGTIRGAGKVNRSTVCISHCEYLVLVSESGLYTMFKNTVADRQAMLEM